MQMIWGEDVKACETRPTHWEEASMLYSLQMNVDEKVIT
jgi:hypothetical protein